MEAEDYSVENILVERRRFIVPIYQRRYQWDDKWLQPFWEDVEAKAGEDLENESSFKHYMGALILSPVSEGSRIGVTQRVLVVDGQQRLTTFQLFLVALREVARQHEYEDLIKDIEGYIFNQLKSKDTDSKVRFKLTPTPWDLDIFHFILDNDYKTVQYHYREYYWGGRVPKNTRVKALRAYYYFKTRIEKFVSLGPSDANFQGPSIESESDNPTECVIQNRLTALLTALLDKMKLVVITLGEEDDAQVIFETLNSKGKPLLAMDLVRNNIFHRAEQQGTSAHELYTRLWDPFDTNWWQDSAPNARPRRPRIDHFLSHVLAAETGKRISLRELYAEYRAFAVPRGRPRFQIVEDELRLLEQHAPTYETLEGRIDKDATLFWLGQKFATWQVTTAYPIAFQIAATNIEDSEKLKLSRLVYSYIVRRALCGLTSKNLNRIFQAMSAKFLSMGVSIDSMQSFFSDRRGDSSRFPGSDDLRQGMLSHPVYLTVPSNRIRDVLWELELASRPRFAEDTGMSSGLWIDHMLPVSWDERWPMPNGDRINRDLFDPRVIERNRSLHSIGNLTLMTAGLNIAASNREFIEKRNRLEEHTSLYMNRWFLRRESWNEDDIKERSADLADKAKNIWPEIEMH